ncbi:MutS domain V family protein [Clavispora lusitaniae]|nr:MutS domain V family protein [Clavispora lusitaniae]OVF10774.1 putative mismatch repair ATPase [Clavispora lusitaniae]
MVRILSTPTVMLRRVKPFFLRRFHASALHQLARAASRPIRATSACDEKCLSIRQGPEENSVRSFISESLEDRRKQPDKGLKKEATHEPDAENDLSDARSSNVDSLDSTSFPTGPPSWDRGGKTKKNALTPLLAAMRKLIDANKGCVCLVQVGSFYELYFEQATNIAPKLGIKVALRRTSNHTVPMAGFPVSQLQKFVRVLVHELRLNVAIVDQYPGAADALLHRRVSRIVTPGTLVDESFLNYSQNNYLAAIYIPPNMASLPDSELSIGLAWIDISVGDFYVQQTTMGELAGDLKRIAPSEVILPKEYSPSNADASWIGEMGDLRKYFVRYHKTAYRDLKSQLRADRQAARKALESFSVREEAAVNMILSYVSVNLPDRNLSLDVPTHYASDKYLHMDSRTRDALELTSRTTFGSHSVVGSLLQTIRRTTTPSGFRLLTQWIKSPILDINELRRRQMYVSLFRRHHLLQLEVRGVLARLGDFVRALQRLALRTGLPALHLQTVGEGLIKLNQIRDIFENHRKAFSEQEAELVQSFLNDFRVPIDIANEILGTLNIEHMHNQHSQHTEGIDIESKDNEAENIEIYANAKKDENYSNEESCVFAIRRDHDPRLLSLHAEVESLQQEEQSLLNNVRTTVTLLDPKATVMRKDQCGRYFNVIQISCRPKFTEEISKMFAEHDVREKRKASLLYKPQSWANLQDKRSSCLHDIENLEKEIINGLRSKVLEQTSLIRHTSRCADFLDVTSSFAVLAEENDFVAPSFVKSPNLNIVAGRHAVVEAGLRENGQMFHPNDTRLNSRENVWVISGPNMGGKSTFLRQNAIIAILAQIGSFVPASKVSMGIVDRIFTRVGAADDLYSDLSTFMVEMIETSNILKNATPRSLAIVDEIGRGTSGKEGLAIAYATLMSLVKKNKCRTLFATHFGREIKDLLEADKVDQSSIRFRKTKIVEQKDQETSVPTISFDYALEDGISDRSYAFEVARLAGFPSYALEYANRALIHLDNGFTKR